MNSVDGNGRWAPEWELHFLEIEGGVKVQVTNARGERVWLRPHGGAPKRTRRPALHLEEGRGDADQSEGQGQNGRAQTGWGASLDIGLGSRSRAGSNRDAFGRGVGGRLTGDDDCRAGQDGRCEDRLSLDGAASDREEFAHRRDTVLNEEDHRWTGLEDVCIGRHLRDVHGDGARLLELGVRGGELEVSLTHVHAVRAEPGSDDDDFDASGIGR